MAGKRLYELMTKRGGKDSDYADIVYGTVIDISPLKIQLENNMVLTNDFIILGKHIGKFKLQGKAKVEIKAHDDQIGSVSGNRPAVKEDIDFPKKKMYIEFDNSLEKNDKVTMIRLDGGQQFYLFERLGEDGYGF